MVRKNLVLDEQLLEDAVRLSGERTYSGVVQRAAMSKPSRPRIP